MMYKWMNGHVWKIEEVGDGTALIRVIAPDNPEYEKAVSEAQPDLQDGHTSS